MRLSLLVSRDFAVLVQAVRSLPAEVSKQYRAAARRVLEPAFKSEMTERAETHLQQRVIVDTARVSIRDDNAILRSATIGKIGDGVPASVLAGGAEFGNDPNRTVVSRSRKGKEYKRRMGGVFRRPQRGGYVFFPAVQAFIPRAGALLWQTAYRTVAETFEKVSK
ncbi:MAG TPA: hypothetical protein VN041_12160 [Microbacterium sp.]|nr:hypothetical protein [Microbacterium sp.]